MAKKKIPINTEPKYVPPIDNQFWFYVGEKYYRRLQPIPYAYKLELGSLKIILNIIQ